MIEARSTTSAEDRAILVGLYPTDGPSPTAASGSPASWPPPTASRSDRWSRSAGCTDPMSRPALTLRPTSARARSRTSPSRWSPRTRTRRLRQRAVPAQIREPRSGEVPRHRPQRAHPRHLRGPGLNARGQAAGRAAQLQYTTPWPAAWSHLRPGRRWRREVGGIGTWPWRAADRDRPTDRREAHRTAQGGARSGPGAARARQGTERPGLDGGPRRVHQRRQVHPPQHAHRRRRLRRRPALRDPRHREPALGGPPRRRHPLSDTVGFVRNLPHHLVASFRSTSPRPPRRPALHVVDASHPEAGSRRRCREVLVEPRSRTTRCLASSTRWTSSTPPSSPSPGRVRPVRGHQRGDRRGLPALADAVIARRAATGRSTSCPTPRPAWRPSSTSDGEVLEGMGGRRLARAGQPASRGGLAGLRRCGPGGVTT